MFNESKVAEMAAYLLLKSGGRMPYLKLMKLLYLADRESMARYGFPISDDHMVSMIHGPVLSRTLNLMNGDSRSQAKWGQLISAPISYDLALRGLFNPESDIDELSKADLEVLDAVWQQFGHFGAFPLRDYTHEHCAEWVDPDGSSFPISPKTVFMAIGDLPDVAEGKADYLNSRRQLAQFLSSMK